MTLRILPLLFYCSLSFAALDSGRLTAFDRYGLPPSPKAGEPLIQAYDRFEKGAKKGGTLKLSDSDSLELIFPGWFQKGIQKQVLPWFDLIFEPLMKPDVRGSLRTLYPGLAKAVRVDSATQTYVIELNESARFSDNTPLNSEDVVFSMKFAEEEVLGAAMKPWIDRNFGKYEIKALSTYEVQLRFPDIAPGNQREALYAFLAWIYIVKNNPAQDPAIQIPNPTIGTGPYVVESATRDKAVLKLGSHFWNKDAPSNNFERIETSIYRDRDVAREAFKRGDLNYFDEPNTQAEGILVDELKKGRFQKHDVTIVDEQIATVGLFMNTARPHMRDLRFRKAIVLLTDIAQANYMYFSDKLSLLNSPGANSRYSPKGEPQEEALELLAKDPLASEALKPFDRMGFEQLARIKVPNGTREQNYRLRKTEALRLLKEAGYSISPYGVTKDGRPVELTVVIMKESRVFRTVSLLQADLQKVGIQLHIMVPSDSAARVNAVKSQRYDFFVGDTFISREFENFDADNVLQRYSSDYSRALHPKVNPSNFSNLNSPAIDQSLKDLIAADRSSPAFGLAADIFLRLISAHVPFILMGERTTSTVYADKQICIPPTNTRILESIYLSEGACP